MNDEQAPPNIYAPHFDERRDRDGFRVDRARIGRQLGGGTLGASLWQLDPGEAAYPYHFHVLAEEMIVVLEGTPQLRTPSGSRVLAAGDVVRFPTGESGAHQLVNRSAERVRFLGVSSGGTEAEILVYPDSEKVLARATAAGDDGLRWIVRMRDAVGFWDGEEPPAA